MSVHWQPKGATKTVRNSTIYHSRAFCHCPDGHRCEDPDFRTDPKKPVVNKKLEARRKAYDAMKPHSGLHRPGSQK